MSRGVHLTPLAPLPVLLAPGPEDRGRSTNQPEVGYCGCDIGLCPPARPRVSQGPFFRGSQRRGPVSPWAASCLGQTMTFAGTRCQLAAAAAKASTSSHAARGCRGPREPAACSPSRERSTRVWPSGLTELGRPFMYQSHTHTSTFCWPSSVWVPRIQIHELRVEQAYKSLSSSCEE